MIVPALLTGGVLALLWRSRTPPPPSGDVPPAQLPAGSSPLGQLPTAPEGTPVNTPAQVFNAPIPPALQEQVDALMAMGEAAPPAELRALADRIALVAPRSDAVAFLRSLADQNLAAVTRSSPATVQGRPSLPGYNAIGQSAEAFRPFSYVAPVAPTYVQNAPNNVQTASASTGADTFRCVDPEGCALFRTPAPLYPIKGASVPGGATVTALQQSGDFLEVRYQNMRGWLPMRALAQVTSGAGVRLGSIFSR